MKLAAPHVDYYHSMENLRSSFAHGDSLRAEGFSVCWHQEGADAGRQCGAKSQVEGGGGGASAENFVLLQSMFVLTFYASCWHF